MKKYRRNKIILCSITVIVMIVAVLNLEFSPMSTTLDLLLGLFFGWNLEKLIGSYKKA